MDAIDYYSMGKSDPLMVMIAICQEFGWTYEEYMSQPNFFLRLIREKLIRDNKEQELAHKNAQHGR